MCTHVQTNLFISSQWTGLQRWLCAWFSYDFGVGDLQSSVYVCIYIQEFVCVCVCSEDPSQIGCTFSFIWKRSPLRQVRTRQERLDRVQHRERKMCKSEKEANYRYCSKSHEWLTKMRQLANLKKIWKRNKKTERSTLFLVLVAFSRTIFRTSGPGEFSMHWSNGLTNRHHSGLWNACQWLFISGRTGFERRCAVHVGLGHVACTEWISSPYMLPWCAMRPENIFKYSVKNFWWQWIL